MDVRLENKVAVITGGSTGIGAATAIEYARAGAKVVFGDINETDAEKTVNTIREEGGVARFLRTDVTVETEVADLMKTADAEFGGIHVLVTAAGVLRGPNVRIDDFEAATFDSVIDVNLKGTFFALKHAVPIMSRCGGWCYLVYRVRSRRSRWELFGCLRLQQRWGQWACHGGRKSGFVNEYPYAIPSVRVDSRPR